MKKLVITNTILLFLVLGIFIFGDYFFNYPENFNVTQAIMGAEWRIFGSIILAIFIFSAGLASFPVKKYRFRSRFLTILAGLNLLLLSFLIFKGLDFFLKNNKRDFEQLVSGYKKKADDDMKSGLITIEYAGGLERPPDEKTQKMKKEIDSLTKTYGLTYRNSGCIVSAALIKAQKEYIKYTKSYLDKRNGAGWESKMEKQIKQIENNYR